MLIIVFLFKNLHLFGSAVIISSPITNAALPITRLQFSLAFAEAQSSYYYSQLSMPNFIDKAFKFASKLLHTFSRCRCH